jgi:cob(I)alamin adenosyltransferase
MKAVQKIKVYTRTGDKGTSSLFNGQRERKNAVVFDALGASDELNAHLGMCWVECDKHERVREMIAELQSRMLDVGSNIATPPASSSESRLRRVAFPETMVEKVESWIDELDEPLPALKNFILPGGCRSSASLHIARTVCRRLERNLWAMEENDVDSVDAIVLRFTNRLSDWLFVAARYVAHQEQAAEIVYKKD